MLEIVALIAAGTLALGAAIGGMVLQDYSGAAADGWWAGVCFILARAVALDRGWWA